MVTKVLDLAGLARRGSILRGGEERVGFARSASVRLLGGEWRGGPSCGLLRQSRRRVSTEMDFYFEEEVSFGIATSLPVANLDSEVKTSED